MRVILRVKEDAGNKKTRQNEEQVHSSPANIETFIEDATEGAIVGFSEVIEHHEQDRDTAQSVEGGNMPCRSAICGPGVYSC